MYHGFLSCLAWHNAAENENFRVITVFVIYGCVKCVFPIAKICYRFIIIIWIWNKCHNDKSCIQNYDLRIVFIGLQHIKWDLRYVSYFHLDFK